MTAGTHAALSFAVAFAWAGWAATWFLRWGDEGYRVPRWLSWTGALIVAALAFWRGMRLRRRRRDRGR